jgi:hypothetical protein
VIGLDLPKDARLARGVLHLHRGQRAELVAAEGLELTYGRSDHFVAAPESIGLPARGWTLVRLRDRATQSEVELRVEPIIVSAEIELSPKRARWPADAVRVSIVPRGASPSEVIVEVTINARPVKVRWMRDASGLRGIVPADSTPGPWVVRVEAKDARGNQIGRNFLEVSRSR